MKTPRLATIRFDADVDSGDAYDQTQYRDDIKMGDILVVPREKVVGFLFSAWPVAVTKAHGSFHARASTSTWDTVLKPAAWEDQEYVTSFKLAVDTAFALGWDLDVD